MYLAEGLSASLMGFIGALLMPMVRQADDGARAAARRANGRHRTFAAGSPKLLAWQTATGCSPGAPGLLTRPPRAAQRPRSPANLRLWGLSAQVVEKNDVPR